MGQLTDSGDAFVIKPSGVRYDALTPGEMVVVDLTGTVIEGSNRPSSDTPTYVELYRYFLSRFDRTNDHFPSGIVHTHSRFAVSWAQARCPIPCFGTTHADHFFGSVPLADALTEDEVQQGYEANTGRVIIRQFERQQLNPIEVPSVLCSGHGPFSWGRTASDAVKNAVALEAVAEMALLTKNINPAAPELEAHVLQKHYNRKHGPNAYYGQKKP